MSAMQAIQARALETLVQFIKSEMAAKGWRQVELARHAFGLREDGKKPINNGYLSTLFTGKVRNVPSDATLGKLANALGCSVQTLLDLRDGRTEAPPALPAKQFVRPYIRRAQALGPVPTPEGAVPFVLMIREDGSAVLRINMNGVPADKAFRVMAAMTAAGLLPTGAEAQAP